MKIIPKLHCSVWVVTLLVMLSLALPVNASGLSIAPIVYGEQMDVSIDYDGASSSMFGYDSTSAHTANEKANRTNTDAAFGHIPEFLAANSGVQLSEKGLGLVEGHLGTFGADAGNTAMMGRLRSAFANGERVAGADANFYLHEASEATMMGRGMSYDAAHAAALEKYGVSPFSLYHPEVIQANPTLFNNAWRAGAGLPPHP